MFQEVDLTGKLIWQMAAADLNKGAGSCNMCGLQYHSNRDAPRLCDAS